MPAQFWLLSLGQYTGQKDVHLSLEAFNKGPVEYYVVFIFLFQEIQ